MNKFITFYCIAVKIFLALLVVIISFTFCTSSQNQPEVEYDYKQELSAKLYKVRNEDSLLMVLHQFSEKNDEVGKMIGYKNLRRYNAQGDTYLMP